MSSQPNLLHVVDSLEIGGLERLVHDLAIARGASSTSIACLSSVGPFGEALRQRGIRVDLIGQQHGLAATLWRMRSYLRTTRPDLLHCHNLRPFLIGAWSARLAGNIPVVMTKHGVAAPSGRMAKRCYRSFLRRAHVVGVSRQTAEMMSNWTGRGGHPVRYIANGISMDSFRDLPSRERARTLLGLPSRAFIVGTVSRVAHCKNHLLLLEIFSRVLGQHPGAVLLIVGDGPLLPTVKARVQELKLEQSVVLLGDRRDVPLILAAMDAFCLPSEVEGMPMTVLEAMAAGLPVVASNVGGIPDVVDEGRTGLLASPDAPEQFEAALVTLACDPARAKDMGRSGRERLVAQFSLERVLAAYEELYREPLSRRARAPWTS